MRTVGGLAPALLALVAVVLAAAIWLELRDRSQDSGTMTPSPAAGLPTVPAADRLAAPDPNRIARWAATILARPLFSPGRRPPATAAEATAPTAAPSLPRIAGVMVTPAGRRAIFAAKGAKPLVVGEGGQVGAFTVQSIEAGQVTLRGPDGVRVLSPAFDPDAPAPTPLAAPTPGLPPNAPPLPPGAPAPGGLAIPGLPGFHLQPQSPGFGGIPGLPTPPPRPAPAPSRASR